MTAKTQRELVDILGAWQLLDFLGQGELKRPRDKNRDPKAKKKEFKTHKAKGKVVSAHYRFEPAWENRGDTTVLATCDAHAYGYREKTRVGLDSDAPSQRTEIALFIGMARRDSIITKLASYLPEHYGAELIERDETIIGVMLLKLTPEGLVKDVELSPLLWALGQAARKQSFEASAFSVAEYTEQVQGIKDDLVAWGESKHGQDKSFTWNEIDAIAHKYARPYLALVEKNTSVEKDLAYRMIDFSHVMPDDVTENQENLSMNFLAGDIEAARRAFESAPSLDALAASSMSLTLNYITGPERAENGCRVDMRHDEGDGKLLRFYNELLNPKNLPLGKWPSQYTLSLMQQAAVNMAAGRIWGQGEFPANDIVSVNGPPGTGKTTLLKDIIAANIVEKARLLSNYADPDDAFVGVPYLHDAEQNNDRTFYMASALKTPEAAHEFYVFADDRINDYGILVCSSNNAAVENISEELPAAGALGKDVKPHKLDTPEDELLQSVYDLFEGKADDARTIDWGTKATPRVEVDTYFSYAAGRQLGDYGNDSEGPEHPHALMAAKLGRRKNINNFARSLNAIVWRIGRGGYEACTKQYLASRKRFLALYSEVSSELDAYAETFDSYTYYHQGVAETRAKLEAAQKRLPELATWRDSAREQIAAYDKQIVELTEAVCLKEHREAPGDWDAISAFWNTREAELAELQAQIRTCDERLARAEAEKVKSDASLLHFGRTRIDEELEAARKESYALEPQRKQFSDKSKSLNEWKLVGEQRSKACEILFGAKKKIQNYSAAVDQLKANLAQYERGLSEASLAEQAGELVRFSTPTEEFIAALEDEDVTWRKSAQLSNPTSSFEIDRKREELFYWALQVTRDFILASKKMRDNLQTLYAMWRNPVPVVAGKESEVVQFHDEDRKRAMPALLQSLLVLTPVVSSTFSSVANMLSDVPIDASTGRAPLGLLVIDEAGQALPMAAVGALSRCRKAVIVGDPKQIDPVVTDDLNLFRKEWTARYGRDYLGSDASVQRLADSGNPYGGYLESDDGEEADWVGCPLVVHRRCISPMFDISNEVSYSGTMLNETRMPSHTEHFCSDISLWINMGGSERGNKNHFVDQQGECVLKLVQLAFAKRPDKSKLPSLYVISPFTSVVRGMRDALKDNCPEDVDPGQWNDFREHSIGTVHTFQGKEAQEVVFLLGCDDNAKGAVKWVPRNIVNVAASRAKCRFYVVGDAKLWQDNNPHAKKMKKILDDQAPQAQAEPSPDAASEEQHADDDPVVSTGAASSSAQVGEIATAGSYTYEQSRVAPRSLRAASTLIREFRASLTSEEHAGKLDTLLGKRGQVAQLNTYLVQVKALEEHEGQFYPSEVGYSRGIRWAQYDQGVGICYTDEGAANLIAFLTNLIG